MSRINTNVSSLTAQLGLAQSQRTLSSTLRHLSTGLRINSGADDPAGLIASESLKSEIAGINSAVSNSQQATNVISTAEGALNEISSLLTNIKQLTVQAANTGAMSPMSWRPISCRSIHPSRASPASPTAPRLPDCI